MDKCGIYIIVCTKNNKFYIGQSNNYLRRFNSHRSYLRRNLHSNHILQNCFNKYGEQSIIIKLLENCSQLLLNDREQYWINKLFNDPLNMNICTDVTAPPRPSGRKHSSETKRKQSLAAMGHKRNIGRKHSEETKEKISKVHKGKNVTDETRQKLREAQTGKTLSDETKQKIGSVHRGNKYNLGRKTSTETKKKISEGNRGKIQSDETKKKISEGNRGKIRTDETKQRISESQKGNTYCKGRVMSDITRNKIKTANSSKSLHRLLSPQGEEYLFYGIKDFCRIHGLYANYIHLLLAKKRESYKGWTNPF